MSRLKTQPIFEKSPSNGRKCRLLGGISWCPHSNLILLLVAIDLRFFPSAFLQTIKAQTTIQTTAHIRVTPSSLQQNSDNVPGPHSWISQNLERSFPHGNLSVGSVFCRPLISGPHIDSSPSLTATVSAMAIETLQAPPHRLVGTDPASQQRPGPPSPGGGRHELPLHQARPRHRPQHRRGDQTMEHSTPKTTARGATVADAASAVSGPDEERWRKHGGARRLQLLEEDRLRGGRDFSMSLDCSIQRYFQAAHWVSDARAEQRYRDMAMEMQDGQRP